MSSTSCLSRTMTVCEAETPANAIELPAVRSKRSSSSRVSANLRKQLLAASEKSGEAESPLEGSQKPAGARRSLNTNDSRPSSGGPAEEGHSEYHSSPLKQEAVAAAAGAETKTCRRVLRLPVPQHFDFSMAICSYGFFCMMPNQWIPPPRPPQTNTKTDTKATGCVGEAESMKEHGVFRRPLRYGAQARRCCLAEITCKEPSCLEVVLDGDVPLNDEEEMEIIHQIKRMCRLDVSGFRGYSIEEFWRLHPEAKARRFGYLFRSPTVWEDMVKTITICNVRWKQSLVMNRLLCNVASSVPGSFPSPWDVGRFTPEELQRLCCLGYRGTRVRRLADSIIDGSLDLAAFDAPRTEAEFSTNATGLVPRPIGTAESTTPRKKRRVREATTNRTEETPQSAVKKKLLSIYGFGRFAAENMMQLLGYFDVNAFDSETVRHMRQVHGFLSKDVKRVLETARNLFEPYRPFQFVAYWFELWKMYEAQTGVLSPYWNSENSFFMDSGSGLPNTVQLEATTICENTN